jgi:hypothetical protein
MHERRVVFVVVVMTAVVSQRRSGKEDDGDDEDEARDDGNPGRGEEDLGGLVDVWRRFSGRRRGSGGRGPRSWGFRCFTHETHDAGVNNSRGYAQLKYQL